MLLVPVNIANRIIDDGIHAVARQFSGAVLIVVDNRIVWARGKFEDIGSHPVVIFPTLLLDHRISRAQMPLADIASIVASGAEVMGQRMSLCWQRDVVAIAAGRRRVNSRLHDRAGRATDGLAGKHRGEMRAAYGETIKVGRQLERVAMQAGGIPALLIGEKDDDIWACTMMRHWYAF